MGTQLREAESGFRYTPTTCFETFPFPHPTDEQRAAIAAAAAELNRLRENWLNPIDPDGKPELECHAELRRRTLTNLYNQRPTWLANAHATLDAAVADAYGWPADFIRRGDSGAAAGAQPGAGGGGSAKIRIELPRPACAILSPTTDRPSPNPGEPHHDYIQKAVDRRRLDGDAR